MRCQAHKKVKFVNKKSSRKPTEKNVKAAYKEMAKV